MYSLTINCDTAAQLGVVAKHLETLDLTGSPKPRTDNKPTRAETDTVEGNPPKPPKTAKTQKAAATPEKEDDGTTYDHVKEATFKLAGLPGDGPKLVKEVLAQFGVDHATKLTEKQWKPYFDAATKKYDDNKPEENLA